MAPTTTQQWLVEDTTGFDALKLQKDVPIPALGDHDCLVEIKAVSLNYRDLIIPKGKYPFPLALPVIPASDGAGTVVSVGSRVSEFKPGDKVCTLFNQGHQAGSLTPKSIGTGLGGAVNGTLREYGVFEETGLVRMPENLTFNEGATLSCAALTAWNALYGQNPLKPGDWVLTQGTGGVSIFAIQFAVAAGATVIATTSSDEKAQKLTALGAKHVINYKTDSEWGTTAAKITPGGEGVHHVVEVGGPESMRQSFKAVKIDGTITVIGFLGGVKGGPSPLEALNNICSIRGVLVGSRQQFQDMNHAIEANDINPVVDPNVFGFDKVLDAYQYQWDQKHFGKVVVSIP
ncbi:putative alcohol dehydrogenase [Phaeomoniella chlamydospora]|uniref:Putative alcohol dehydrogenase n=1 Tax=Phaeomoniella chlamydospora TaxID=158046 RepID=A0A0G2GZY2_PHACM|nr:putative alcohol dehydrogenase [Phaeomoniella chlamydospora]